MDENDNVSRASNKEQLHIVSPSAARGITNPSSSKFKHLFIAYSQENTSFFLETSSGERFAFILTGLSKNEAVCFG